MSGMKPKEVYACYNVNEEVRLNSSSGAVFSALAEYVLEQHGVVYGVAMAEDCYFAEFISVESIEELKKLCGSKYLQARMGNTYKSVKNDLDTGRIVLFTGTGCQINGLKGFLKKEYDNLICTDVICHGAPSPGLWRKYAKYREEQNHRKLKNINFRCKNDGWADFGMKEEMNDISANELKKMYISKKTDPYMQMFLRDYCLRPSCYECKAKTVKMADMTIADFWGIDNIAPDMNDGLGTSLVLVRTDKGKRIFNEISNCMKLKKVSYEDGVRSNPAEFRSCIRPQQRNIFFEDMHNMTFDELRMKYAAPIQVGYSTRIKRKMKQLICKIMVNGGVHKVNNMNYGLLFVFDCEESYEGNTDFV